MSRDGYKGQRTIWMWPVSLIGILSKAVACGTSMFFLIIDASRAEIG
jgi:hypothetical protein